MLENAIKYSSGGNVALTVEVSPVAGGHQVSVRMANPAPPAHRERLAALIDQLKRAPDPLAFYVSLMRESAARKQGSGLGLGRIRFESEMQLAHAGQGDWVEVTASAICAKGTS